jgi:hypothetical protein
MKVSALLIALLAIALPATSFAFSPKFIQKHMAKKVGIVKAVKTDNKLGCTDFNGYWEGTCLDPQSGDKVAWGAYISQESCSSINMIYAQLDSVMGISSAEAKEAYALSTNLKWGANKTTLVSTQNGTWQDNSIGGMSVGYDTNATYSLKGGVLEAVGTITYKVIHDGALQTVQYPVSCTATKASK